MEHTAFIGVGSNLGPREVQLRQALQWIEEEIGTLIRASNIYQTSPWGGIDQPDYLNQVWQIRTGLGPFHLMTALLELEKRANRERLQRWGARTLDLDLLFYDDYRIRTAFLTLPHPQIQNRNFVLVPLAEIAPDWLHPVLGKTAAELAAKSPDEEIVRIWAGN
ncbi:2-amino-4-hydroxy-6-hydroxymethyldihydropteridine diphosphokinase [Flavilitoribacter nigricans]|uniref:2-amino-4-hydroxy-6-hydroxymethyldihydropteridine pyrophosphokinase n=1 Tax=Flavilitoribacter nigricans (strain ATCC 23147 / DSM 23189 / NBRC 102662 / NCIMB 1420 / SS-2) TaxID=1122177 RepID=A0A2D0NEI2_FLAN2|nr:2-amino-4-hydroxy-6-hydroxymethyldihydropteridine diphosphokinase [Flavilitoribacter nigricans]PHN06914.1 2-amino-4-hydroxy-6-hydroxymethyldihydropteridine diphosphokinase [Flavilitoribacter nigricans DSM 23189 = NBRC 102662]